LWPVFPQEMWEVTGCVTPLVRAWVLRASRACHQVTVLHLQRVSAYGVQKVVEVAWWWRTVLSRLVDLVLASQSDLLLLETEAVEEVVVVVAFVARVSTDPLSMQTSVISAEVVVAAAEILAFVYLYAHCR
jgi:hypothetical protein